MLRAPNLLPLFTLLLLPWLGGCADRTNDGPPDRIVLIVVDMLRRDKVGAYGGPETPNIDALARRGQVATNALASFHQTSMSMGALFTGRTPSLESEEREKELPWTSETWCGMARFRSPEMPTDVCIGAEMPTLAQSIRDLGYTTLAVTSNPLIFKPLGYEVGFDEWVEVGVSAPRPEDRRPLRPNKENWVTDARLRDANHVNDAVRAVLSARKTDRFFLYVHYMDVHDHARLGATYADGVAAVDRGLGQLFALLEDEGLTRDALIVFVSDHGELVGERVPMPTMGHFGNPSFEPVLRIPLIASRPILASSDRFVRGQDLFGILTKVAGGEMRPPADTEPDEIFLSEMNFQTYRRGRWKSTWSRRDGGFHLFDLEAVPAEGRDVAAEHPDIAAEHRARIETLAANLRSGAGAERGKLSADEEHRLRSLGYLE